MNRVQREARVCELWYIQDDWVEFRLVSTYPPPPEVLNDVSTVVVAGGAAVAVGGAAVVVGGAAVVVVSAGHSEGATTVQTHSMYSLLPVHDVRSA